ncbi:MAG: hypothetical protein AAF468_21205 [Pseudomonadota bacterium]
MGLLSQAVANLQAAERTVTGIQGLPQGAIPVRDASVRLVSRVAKAAPKLQQKVAAYQSATSADLEKGRSLAAYVNTGSNTKNLVALLKKIQKQTVSLRQPVKACRDVADTADKELIGYTKKLSTVQQGLQAKNSDLRSKQAAAQAKADAWLAQAIAVAAQQRAVGIMAGYAGPNLGMLQIVNKYRDQASAVQSQISHNNMMITATQQMNTDFVDVKSKLSGVENTITMVDGHIDSIIHDLKAGELQPMEAVYYTEAIKHQISSMVNEAS